MTQAVTVNSICFHRRSPPTPPIVSARVSDICTAGWLVHTEPCHCLARLRASRNDGLVSTASTVLVGTGYVESRCHI